MPHANAMMVVLDTTIVVMIMKHCAWEAVLVDAKMVSCTLINFYFVLKMVEKFLRISIL